MQEKNDLMEIPIERGAEILGRVEVDGERQQAWTTFERSLRRSLTADQTFGEK